MEPLIFKPDKIIYIESPSVRFNEIIPVIPTNTIINKTIPGLGATYTEIKANRNSIIVLPNVASIHSKHKFHELTDNTLAVFEGITEHDIIKYLKQQSKYKKLLTTPESLEKIIKALSATSISYKQDYFILIDESHKIITDSKYRPQISKAFQYFFDFDGKAMVSSTPIMPSDERFAEFKYLKLQPNFDYAYPVEILYHNSVINALSDTFMRHPEVQQCIFFNSINGITDIIRKLGIGDQSMIFCSKESRNYLKKQEYILGKTFSASDKFDDTFMTQYNFFTSSLYNGLDIILDELPQVIMISISGDNKTYLDPYTDVVQILGRFRRRSNSIMGFYAQAIHLVTNSDSGVVKTKDEVTTWLSVNKKAYDTILALMYSSLSPVEKITYQEVLRRLPYHNFMLNADHLKVNIPCRIGPLSEPNLKLYDLNMFQIDNLYESERLNSYYAVLANLSLAYQEVGLIGNDTIYKAFVIYGNVREFPYDQRIKINLRNGKRYAKENVKDIVGQLVNISWFEGEHYLHNRAVDEITRNHPLVFEAWHKLGLEKIIKLDFSISKIRIALIDYDVKDGKNKHPVIDMVYNKFPLKIKLPLKKIKENLQVIYDHFSIKGIAKASDLEQWFELREVKIITYKLQTSKDAPKKKERNEQRGYILLSRKFNMHRYLSPS